MNQQRQRRRRVRALNADLSAGLTSLSTLSILPFVNTITGTSMSVSAGTTTSQSWTMYMCSPDLQSSARTAQLKSVVVRFCPTLNTGIPLSAQLQFIDPATSVAVPASPVRPLNIYQSTTLVAQFPVSNYRLTSDNTNLIFNLRVNNPSGNAITIFMDMTFRLRVVRDNA